MLRRVVVAGLVLAASSLVDAIPVHGVELESEVLDLEEINLPAMIEFEASEPVKVDIPPPTPAPAAPIVQGRFLCSFYSFSLIDGEHLFPHLPLEMNVFRAYVVEFFV